MGGKNLDSWPAFELDEIDEAGYFRGFFRPETGLKIENPEAFKAVLFAAYNFVDGMEELLIKLHAEGAQMWVHSNYTRWLGEIRSRLSLDRFFNGYAMSYELGARKPDREAYTAALTLFQEAPEHCIFIDDREANVLAAIEVGMKGIIFKDVRQTARGTHPPWF